MTLNMYSIDFLVNHVENAVKKAFDNQSKLTDEILNMVGMTGKKTRHLYNNICDLDQNIHYLEVGTWKGSSLISSMYKNNVTATSIDNWSENDDKTAVPEFQKNIKQFLGNDVAKIKTVNKNSWEVVDSDIQRSIDIYMYDGWHSYEAQKKAITYYHKYFSKYVIILVDDWVCDWVQVREGTYDGLKEMNLKIHYAKEIGLVNTTAYHQGGDTFWNGCGIFVCERTDI